MRLHNHFQSLPWPSIHRACCLLIVCAMALSLTGCGRSDPDYFGTIRPLHPPDEIWINNSNEPEWIDPGKCSDSTGGEVIWNMFEGLVHLHPATLDPMPGMAERFELSSDSKTYTFYLRESVWSDGEPFTARDFEWSWKRVLDPKTASKYSMIMFPLKNGDVFNLKALHVRGAESLSDEQIEAAFGRVIEVTKIKRDGDHVFVFVNEPTDETTGEVTLSREQAIELLTAKPVEGQKLAITVADDSVVGVRALSDTELQVELEVPVPYFLNLIGFYTFMPVPRHLIEKLESSGLNPDLWTRPEYVVCNGPYKMTQWRFRQHMIFERNDRYWNVDAPHICQTKTIRVLMIDSYNTALNMYCTGEIDWLGGQTMVPSEFIDRMQHYQDYENSPYLGAYFYWFNTTRPPVDNPLVRKALSLAIDREKITKYVTRGGQIPTASIVPDGLAGYQAIDQPMFDPEAAKQALAEAGYPGGKGLPQITLIYNTTEQHKQIASAAQQMWKQHLGIDVIIENQEWKVYLGRLQKVDFQIARLGWIGDYADPNTFLELFASTNGNNHSNWVDTTFDEMLLAANATADKQQRLDKLRAAEAYAFEQQPMLPIYVYTKSTMVKPYLGGFYGNYQDRHPWKYFYIKDEWYDGKPSTVTREEPPPVTPLSGGSL